jgi:hypothetical protein
MKKACILFTIAIIFFSCRTPHFTSPETFRGKKVIISEGGGFSGQTTQHIILENGQVFVRTVYPASLEETEKLDRKTVRELFERVDALKLNELDFQHPGNMTYSMASSLEGKQYFEIRWGDPDYPAPDLVIECYQYILDQIK